MKVALFGSKNIENLLEKKKAVPLGLLIFITNQNHNDKIMELQK